jgi:anti-sigma-K factor RskA
MKPSAYLDAVKAQLEIESDYALAKRMEVTRGQILAMRNGSRPIPLAVAFKVAITLQLDPAEVIADLEEQREKNPKRRDFWRSFLSRAALVIVTVACTLALSFSAISEGGAARLGGNKRRSLYYA